MKIVVFEAENVKRLRAATLNPKPDGITAIGGRNGQGKTTVLDTILALVKGGGAMPSDPIRDGEKEGSASMTLDNGTRVEMALKTGRDGSVKRSIKVEGGPVDGTPQSVLDALFGKNALDVGRILKASDKERRDILLKTMGAEDELAFLDKAIAETYEDRRVSRKMLDAAEAKEKALEQSQDGPIPTQQDVVAYRENLDVLIEKQTQVERQLFDLKSSRLREENLVRNINGNQTRIEQLHEEIASMEREIGSWQEQLDQVRAERGFVSPERLETRRATLGDQVQQARASLAEVENRFSDTNRLRDVAAERERLAGDFAFLEKRLNNLRAQRAELLASMNWPLEGMSLTEDMEFTFNGKKWDCMAGAERIRVAAAIQAAITPECRILLCDGLESLDQDSLGELNAWATENKIQIIGTKVTSDRSGVEIYIEDGAVV